jgi:hypothetical protein
MCLVLSAFGSLLVYLININTADLNLITGLLYWKSFTVAVCPC